MPTELKFPYPELTVIPAGTEAILWNGHFKGPCYRYLWYELSHDGSGNYLIAGLKPIDVGNYASLCTMRDKLFKLSLLSQLYVLKTLPDTHGNDDPHVINLIREKLRNIG